MESIRLAKFSVSKELLLKALVCIANIADRAIVAAIVHPTEGILGFSFNNVLAEGDPDYQLYAGYAITTSEMHDPEFVEAKDWALFYISCTEEFINAIATLMPKDEETKELEIDFYNIRDESNPNIVKSEAVILGLHNSVVKSILRHPSRLEPKESKSKIEISGDQAMLYR